MASRGLPIAELTWTDPKQKNWDDFKRRIQTQLDRLKVSGCALPTPKKDDAVGNRAPQESAR